MATEYNSFVFYETTYKTICALPENERLKFFNWIIEYGLYGKRPEKASPLENAALTPIFDGIDRAQARYKQSIENGKKGGRPQIFSDEQKQDILDDLNSGANITEIAEKHKCHKNTIYNIKAEFQKSKNLNININDNINTNTDNMIYDSIHSNECTPFKNANSSKSDNTSYDSEPLSEKAVYDFYIRHKEIVVTPSEFWKYNQERNWIDAKGAKIANWQGAYINMNSYKTAQYKTIGRELPAHNDNLKFKISDYINAEPPIDLS